MANSFVMTGTAKTTTIGKIARTMLSIAKTIFIRFSRFDFLHVFLYSYLCIITDVVAPGSADSSGDYYGLHHDGSSWTIKEYGTKENSYSLCTFIGMHYINVNNLFDNFRHNDSTTTKTGIM